MNRFFSSFKLLLSIICFFDSGVSPVGKKAVKGIFPLFEGHFPHLDIGFHYSNFVDHLEIVNQLFQVVIVHVFHQLHKIGNFILIVQTRILPQQLSVIIVFV